MTAAADAARRAPQRPATRRAARAPGWRLRAGSAIMSPHRLPARRGG